MFYNFTFFNIIYRMDLTFLTDKLCVPLNKIDTEKLYEIRLRTNYAVCVNYGGKRLFLSQSGITRYENAAIKCDLTLINAVIDNLTEHSVYAFNESLKKGFLPANNGVRVGVAGECVFGDKLITIKNIRSLNVRIPHRIKGASDGFFNKIKDDGEFYNTLIISPPFCGKTTVLKDIAEKIDAYYDKNLLIIDERGEFSDVKGKNIDVIKYSDKLYAFDCGIRAMSPDVVITDELVEKNDWICVERAVNSGIKIISSCHAASLEEVIRKEYFKSVVFERYVVLRKRRFGEVFKVYDNLYNEL